MTDSPRPKTMAKDDLSFSDMEQAKRQSEGGRYGAPSRPPMGVSFGMDPGGGPQQDPTDNSMMEQRSRPEDESLELRHVLEMLRRHRVLIALLVVLFPAAIYTYDKVLNQPYIPLEYRVGATQVFAAKVEFERIASLQEEFSLPGVPIQFSTVHLASINALMQDPGVREMYCSRLEKDAQLASGKAKEQLDEFIAQYREGKSAPASFSLSSRYLKTQDGTVETVEATGQHRELLPILVRNIVPALNAYVLQTRRAEIAAYESKLKRMQDDLNQQILLTWKRLQEVNTQLSQASSSGTKKGISLDDVQKAQWEVKSIEIELEYTKRRVRYEELAKKFHIQAEEDIAKVLLTNPLRKELAEIEAKLLEARSKYLDAHPVVQQLQGDRAAKVEQLKASGGATSLGKVPPIPKPTEVDALLKVQDLTNAVALKQRLYEGIRKEFLAVPDDGGLAAKNVALTGERETVRAELSSYRTQALALRRDIRDLDIALGQFRPTSIFVQIFSESGARQISPKVMPHVALALMAGLLLGCGLAYLIEYFDDRFHAPSDIWYHLHLRFLGVVPFWRDATQRVIAPDQPDSQVAEIYAHLCNNVRYGSRGHPERRLMIASATQGEGKSLTAVNMAIRYALEGQSVLLIDTDMRHPRAVRYLKPYLFEDTIEKGLSEYLMVEAQSDEILYATTIPGLHLIPSGMQVRNAVKLLAQERFVELLDELEPQFDTIVVDSPAVLPIVDASVIAPHMYGVLLVVGAHDVATGAARMCLARLQHVHAPIVGAVLNKVKAHASTYSYYGYRGAEYGMPYGNLYADKEEEL